jgi:hypothetical protein
VEAQMKFMLLVYEDEKIYDQDPPSPALAGIMEKYDAFAKSLGSKLFSGMGLQGTSAAISVRTRSNAQTVAPGPFAQTHEQLVGFYVIDVADREEAIAIAKQAPLVEDGTIEIRPVL